MRRRKVLQLLGAGAASTALGDGCLPRPAQRRPNILFIMSDDHAVNALSCYRSRLSEVAPTPNIDRIALRGMRFTSCFCTNSICTPSRASIITGKYSHNNGVYTLSDPLNPNQRNVAQLLSGGGYRTAIIGKWHLHSDPSGFDYWNILPGQGKYFDPILIDCTKGEQAYSGYSTDVITDLAIDWMKGRNNGEPFFLMCHFKAPHEPWEYPARLKDYLADFQIPEPESLWEDKSHRSDGSRGYGLTIETMAERQTRKNYHSEGPVDFSGLTPAQRRSKTYQIFLKRYLRTITAVDENVGRLLDYLERSGQAVNTVVIYTSDQGYLLGEHNYMDKRWMYEESLAMPLLVSWPGEIKPGSVSDRIVINTDFAATFLDLAGMDAPGDMQGRSIRGLLKGEPPSDWRTAMYYRYWLHEHRPAHYGLRTDRYKLIFFYGLPLGMTGAFEKPTKAGWELYDLKKDPEELHNVYVDPRYAGLVKDLKKQLNKLRQELGDNDEKYPELLELQQEYR
ncbi:sulfatase [candidate division KSB1 bacterium]